MQVIKIAHKTKIVLLPKLDNSLFFLYNGIIRKLKTPFKLQDFDLCKKDESKNTLVLISMSCIVHILKDRGWVGEGGVVGEMGRRFLHSIP